jgi:hypothetical protein
VPAKAAIESNEAIVPLSEDALAMMLGLVESVEAFEARPMQLDDSPL